MQKTEKNWRNLVAISSVNTPVTAWSRDDETEGTMSTALSSRDSDFISCCISEDIDLLDF